MVEHTREHRRLPQESPPGRRESVGGGTLFLPAGLKARPGMPLLVMFHGGTWLPEAVARIRHTAVLWFQLGAGSGVYSRAFASSGRFAGLLAEAEDKSAVRFGRITLAGWSAGCGAIRQILADSASRERVAGVILIDGIHTDYVGGKPGPQESQLDPEPLRVFVEFAREAIAGRKRMIVTHSEIFPGTYASTTETADYLLGKLGLPRRAVVKWGPMGTQLLSEARRGRFTLLGFAGNSAPDHVDQLHSLPEYLRWLRK